MAIFVVFRVHNQPNMAAALLRVFPQDHMKIETGEWLVASPGTAKDVSDRLGVSEGDTGPAMIFKMSNYYGRASTDIWDWIKAKAETSDG